MLPFALPAQIDASDGTRAGCRDRGSEATTQLDPFYPFGVFAPYLSPSPPSRRRCTYTGEHNHVPETGFTRLAGREDQIRDRGQHCLSARHSQRSANEVVLHIDHDERRPGARRVRGRCGRAGHLGGSGDVVADERACEGACEPPHVG